MQSLFKEKGGIHAVCVSNHFSPTKDYSVIHDGVAQMIGVPNVEQACLIARRLKENGIDCIELCGAFGPHGAQAVIDATENSIPIGYVTHLPQQDALYRKVFCESCDI